VSKSAVWHLAALLLLLFAADAAADADRQGQFKQHTDTLSVCVTFNLKEAHPELRLNLHVGEPMTLIAMTDTTEESKLWTMEFGEKQAGVADVTLHNVKATAPDLDAAWRTVEDCTKQN
jgi:hypothetical protein